MPEVTTTTMDALPQGTVFSVDVAKREIRGRGVPYGVVGLKAGKKWQFSKGTVRPREEGFAVKLWALHDQKHASGRVTEWNDTDDGLDVAFTVANTPEGDNALAQADGGVWDGLSIGPSEGAKFRLLDGVYHAVDVPIHEISLTPAPVFGGARVQSVTFDAITEGTPMPDETTTEETPAAAVDFSALSTSMTDAIAKGFAGLSDPQGNGPTVVPAGAVLEVNEESPYRFDGVPGAHDFSTDLISGLRDGDTEAHERVMTFMAEAFTPAFDVDTGNVTTLNPARNRPDMYVDERRFRTPLYDALHKGAITDMTPFLFPKFGSAAGLVAPHVEGVEPTPGSFTATNQTVTPSAVSGKVEITREVWDQGGNPQVSGLIWNKMVQHYFSALEVSAYTILNANVASITDIPLTTAAADDDLVNELEAAIADLNFVAGGNTFNYAATHANLYKKLAAAADSTGRKLLPMYGPTNANGGARARFTSLDVAGVEFDPVPSLGASSANTSNSFLVDTGCVHLWNSAPQRLEFQYRVAYVDLAIWGYVATAISDFGGVRQVTYDPTA